MRKLSIFAATLLLASCSLVLGIPPDDEGLIREDFSEADRPSFKVVTLSDGNTYKLQLPWNYDKSWNASRSYPLIVSLHGSGGDYYAPCYVGDDEWMQAHPAFFLAPHNASGWGSSASWVRDEIERLNTVYRINTNRVYLMGFSMGGSGSYAFAHLDYNEHGRLFAAIVRLAGQSETELRDAIADKTSIWYHIGLSDDAARVTVAEKAYEYIKSYSGNAKATENTVSDTVGSYPRTTKTLTKNGIQIMKLSEYTGMGHDGSTPFEDEGVLTWLFDQSLGYR
jgi:predicted peptidase